MVYINGILVRRRGYYHGVGKENFIYYIKNLDTMKEVI